MRRSVSKKGFTLIEVIVVVGIVGLLMPALFSVVFGIVREQAKIQALKQVKREGDFLLSSMENNIRNFAVSVHNNTPSEDNSNAECIGVDQEYSSSPFFFKDKFGNWFQYVFDSSGSKVSSESSILNTCNNDNPCDLTSSKVAVTQFSLSCTSSSSFSPPVVHVSFDMEYGQGQQRIEDKALLHYDTKIKLRSY